MTIVTRLSQEDGIWFTEPGMAHPIESGAHSKYVW